MTKSIPRLERIFWDLRDKKIDQIKNDYFGRDDGSGDQKRQKYNLNVDPDKTEEEKEEVLRKWFKFPKYED